MKNDYNDGVVPSVYSRVSVKETGQLQGEGMKNLNGLCQKGSRHKRLKH